MIDRGLVLIGANGVDALAGLDEALADEGYSVRTVGDATTLMSYIASQSPDLVLIDESIREMAPLEIVRHVRHRVGSRDVPLIIMSSQLRGDDAAAAIRAGVSDYIRKPFERSEMIARITSHIERGRLIREARREADTQSIVLEVIRDVTASISSEEIYDILVRRVSRLFEIRRCSMIVVEEGGERGTVVAAHDDPSISALSLDLRRYPEIRMAVETGAPVLVRDLKASALFEQIRPLWENEKIDVQHPLPDRMALVESGFVDFEVGKLGSRDEEGRAAVANDRFRRDYRGSSLPG